MNYVASLHEKEKEITTVVLSVGVLSNFSLLDICPEDSEFAACNGLLELVVP